MTTSNRYLFVEECLQIGSFYQSFVSLYYKQLSTFDLLPFCLPTDYIYDIYDRDTFDPTGFTPQSLLKFCQS